MNVAVLTSDGSPSGEIALRDEIFAAKVNVPLMHQVVTAQLSAARAGTHSTKTRAEVRGGGRKPWRQKGTGRARHGSIREPQWVGGGIAFGPKPRDHAADPPKKMKVLALRSALSAHAAEGRVLAVEDVTFEHPKTKEALAMLQAWGVEGKALLVLAGDETNTAYAFRNLPRVHVIAEHQLNVYDVLNADTVIFVRRALESFQGRAERRSAAPTGAATEADVVPAPEEPAPAEPEAETPAAGEVSE